jgi:bacillolysin/neutral peptidase B
VIGATARLEYRNETGAQRVLPDILIIVSNFAEPDMDKWNWLIGDGISSGLGLARFSQNPPNLASRSTYDQFVRTTKDEGGVHTNSGIHNYAAYKIMIAMIPAGPTCSIQLI